MDLDTGAGLKDMTSVLRVARLLTWIPAIGVNDST